MKLERELVEIENQIYSMENEYLLESKYKTEKDEYLKKRDSLKSGKTSRENQYCSKISENERLFSLSSCTSKANKNLKREIEYSSKLEKEHENLNHFLKMRNHRSSSPCLFQDKIINNNSDLSSKKKIEKKNNKNFYKLKLPHDLVPKKKKIVGIKTRRMIRKKRFN
jgi:hypothetical protein